MHFPTLLPVFLVGGAAAGVVKRADATGNGKIIVYSGEAGHIPSEVDPSKIKGCITATGRFLGTSDTSSLNCATFTADGSRVSSSNGHSSFQDETTEKGAGRLYALSFTPDPEALELTWFTTDFGWLAEQNFNFVFEASTPAEGVETPIWEYTNGDAPQLDTFNFLWQK